VVPALVIARAVRGVVASGRWQRVVPAYAIGSTAFLWVLERAVTLLD